MHLETLQLFCDIARRRSFSRAAADHSVSQSRASQAVQMLEEHLGVQLIDRSTRPFELTPAGDEYLQGCVALLEGYQQLERRIADRDGQIAGRLRIAAIYSVGLLRMDRYIKRFRRQHREARISMEYLHPDEVYERIRAEDVELGIVSFPRDGGEFSSIEWQQQKMVLATSTDHPLAARQSVAVAEIQGLDFVAFQSDLTIRRRITRWLKDAKVSVNVVQEFDDIENIKRAVEIGTGIAILPEDTIQREIQFESLVAIPFSDADWYRPLGIVHRRHRSLSSAAEKFIELLHDPSVDESAARVPNPRNATTADPSQHNRT